MAIIQDNVFNLKPALFEGHAATAEEVPEEYGPCAPVSSLESWLSLYLDVKLLS